MSKKRFVSSLVYYKFDCISRFKKKLWKMNLRKQIKIKESFSEEKQNGCNLAAVFLGVKNEVSTYHVKIYKSKVFLLLLII